MCRLQAAISHQIRVLLNYTNKFSKFVSTLVLTISGFIRSWIWREWDHETQWRQVWNASMKKSSRVRDIWFKYWMTCEGKKGDHFWVEVCFHSVRMFVGRGEAELRHTIHTPFTETLERLKRVSQMEAR